VSDDVLVCSPVRRLDGSVTDAVEGSTIMRCADCGVDVWVAPSGVQNLARLSLVVVCIPCGLARMRDDPTPTIAATTQEQLDELRAHYRRD